MFFLISKLLWWFLTPSHVLMWMAVTTSILLYMGRERLGRWFAAATALLFVAIGIFPLNIWLLRSLEDRIPRANLPAHVDGILTLGGGLDTAILKSRGVPGPGHGEPRLVAAFELARRYPNARVVFSGGSGEVGGALPETQAAQYIFNQMGLSPSRLVLERKSRNTWENILNAQRIANPRPGEIWVLATSAFHMPRAMEVAARLKWKMVPWPTDYLTEQRGLSGFFDVLHNLEFTDMAVHEWIGLMAYRLRASPPSRDGKGA